jgi:hypothetical protein
LEELDEAGVGEFKPRHIDIETYPIFRAIKIWMLGQILRENIDRKYAISISKGVKIVMESVILILLIASVVIKANLFSFVYLMLTVRYLFCDYK